MNKNDLLFDCRGISGAIVDLSQEHDIILFIGIRHENGYSIFLSNHDETTFDVHDTEMTFAEFERILIKHSELETGNIHCIIDQYYDSINEIINVM